MVFDFQNQPSTNGSINEDGPGGKYGYRIGHSDGSYQIPDRLPNAVDDCKVRVITIGAGISGILMAHLIQRDCTNVEHVIYEKNGDIGGTWLEVRKCPRV
jgi:hydroxyversicolorone monooxygenase